VKILRDKVYGEGSHTMRSLGTLLVLLVAALIMSAPATAAPRDTSIRTIQDTDGDNLLEFAPGEDHCVFSLSLTPASPDCEAAQLTGPKQDSILNFLQLSDFQVVDEESPARVEAVDTTQRVPGANPFSAAYRPQESLTTQTTEAMVRQARNTTSPITGARLALTILTGDNADSQQYNETRWFIDLLDGTTGSQTKIDPDSGIDTPESTATCGPAYTDNGSPYDGVRDDGGPGQDAGYYEPDGEGDGDGYTPDRARNQAEVPGPHADVTVRDFPGLFEDAQQPFEAVGLGMPWYSAFGNHDALVQGNSGEAFVGPFGNEDEPETVNPVFDAIARGCVKPTKLPAGVTPEEFMADPLAFASDPGAGTMIVPPDPRRCFLAKDEPNTAALPCSTGGWIQQHNDTRGLPQGHGFEPFSADGQSGAGRPASARLAHDGYYSFVPRPGVRFIVLDTITDECGAPVCAEGSVDDAQYRWLEDEVTAADAAGQYVLVFSHHTLRTTRFPSSDPSEQPIHYGERQDRKDGQPVRPDAPPGTTLEDLFCRHDNVLAHVNGHEHQNYVLPHRCEDPGQGQNPFVEVSTAAHIDWPQQSRTIELLDDGGTVSLALTVLDHAGPPNPGNGNASEQPVKLASIAREIAYNDYQGSRGARGEREDRNVIVRTDKPWPAP
jgi:metallophosphoesterase (TIGR03767 family)